MSHRRRLSSTVALAMTLLLSACATTTTITVAEPAGPVPTPYAGPLIVPAAAGVQPWLDPGAADGVVDCDHPAIGRTSTTPYTGGEVGETPKAALQQG